MGRKLFFGIVLSMSIFFISDNVSYAAYRDDFPDFEGILVDHDEVWRKNEAHLIDRDLRIVDGAKLTIEPGAHVAFRSDGYGWPASLSVTDGSIEAIGTSDDPIFFERESEMDAFYIDFSDYTERESVFRYVRIVGGGYRYDTGGSVSFWKRFFVSRALAAGEDGIAAVSFWGGKLLIENSVFSGSAIADIWAYNSQIEEWDAQSSFVVRDVDFNGDVNIPALRVEDSSCDNFVPSCPRKITFENNWYGDTSGPKAESNPSGTGKEIVGTINLNGWSASRHTCVENCHSNVMFLPGLMGSRLYDDQDSSCVADKTDPKRAWEPSCNADARKLYMDADGKSLDSDIHTKEGDILDEVSFGINIYKTFMDRMDALKDTDHSIRDWKPVAYDWRLSYDDILADGSIESALRMLAEGSNTKKVTLVAHSNGGLLAKALMKKLGDSEVAKLVDKVILVAVPQTGTPEAIAGMLNGERQNIFPVMDTETARGLAENMPGAYQLLPSEQYFSTVETPAVTFDISDSSDLKGKYGNPIDSMSKLYDFLTDSHRRVAATDGDTDIPTKLNSGLLDDAKSVHDTLDNWSAPNGVKVMQIAGWGVPATIKGVKYFSEKRKHCDASVCTIADFLSLDDDMDFTIDGDGTVVFPSALYMGGAERYWVDLAAYNIPLNRLSDGRFLEVSHSDILEIPELNTFIVDSMADNLKPIIDYKYLSTEVPISNNKKRIQYSLHSPLTLDLYDDQGRHTGVSSDGNIEEGIPGTYYRQFGDVKYIFADEAAPVRISMSGYDAGTFTFSAKELQGDTVLGTVTFQDMPTTPETEVSFDMPSDLEHASDLRIDIEGDGIVDHQLQPKIGEVVTLEEKDALSPVTEISPSGTQGLNGWYMNDVTVTLAATDGDSGSGIEKTEYSMDSGTTWTTYLEPFVVSREGMTVTQYRSADKAGNKEEIKIQEIKIDKTAPEAKIIFNQAMQKLDITGIDNLGQVVAVTLAGAAVSDGSPSVIPGLTRNPESSSRLSFRPSLRAEESKRDGKWKQKTFFTAALTDQAGHTTELTFDKKQDKERRLSLNLVSISYDRVRENLSDTSLTYKWVYNGKKGKYAMLASSFKVGSQRTESHYRPKKDMTMIMSKPQDLNDRDDDDDAETRPARQRLPGLVIPYMQSEKGKILVKY